MKVIFIFFTVFYYFKHIYTHIPPMLSSVLIIFLFNCILLSPLIFLQTFKCCVVDHISVTVHCELHKGFKLPETLSKKCVIGYHQ